MKFLILGRREIRTFLTNQKHIVISIYASGLKPVKLPKQESRLATLFLHFDDLNDSKEWEEFGYKILDESQAQNIITFFFEYKDKIELTICQCEVGISRSSAVGGALSKLIGQNNDDFFKSYVPNKYVYWKILKTYYDRKHT